MESLRLSPLSTKPRIETPNNRGAPFPPYVCLSPLSTKPRIETYVPADTLASHGFRLSPLSTKPRIETNGSEFPN